MATSRFIETLEQQGHRVKAMGDSRFMTTCPAHSDSTPSLSFRSGRSGVALYCHGGCSTKEVVIALGLTERDLFDDPQGENYKYYVGSRLVREVMRTPEKRFFQKVYDQSATVGLYVPEGVDPRATEVYIAEGEKDAETLASVGVAAVSAPMGAANWHLCDYSPLYGASRIVIVADKDEPGIKRALGLRKHLRENCPAEVLIVESAQGKDATDHIVTGYSPSEFVPSDVPTEDENDAVLETDIAEERRRNFVREEARRRDAAERLAAAPAVLRPKTLREVMATPLDYHWVVPGLLEVGDRMVITGAEGGGKSMLLRQIGLCAAVGMNPFEDMFEEYDPAEGPSSVMFIDAENSERQWARQSARLIRQVTTRTGIDPMDTTIVAAGTRIDISRPEGMREIHALLTEHNPKILVIGPLYKLVPFEIKTDEQASPLLAALDSIRERGICLLMEAHAGHDRSNMRPRGSSALLGWPEMGFGLRPRDEERTVMDVVRWRGDREERNLPDALVRGQEKLGELPWVRA